MLSITYVMVRSAEGASRTTHGGLPHPAFVSRPIPSHARRPGPTPALARASAQVTKDT